ncbi:MAG: HEAT repeat domain-containing protein, partial [Planctomycetota bacterium]|nr:HEAT repeat domain-containing protein [Planctomycetota bacterium]
IAVCESLGLQANTDSIGRLEGVVNGDTENNVRLAAARALGNIPDPSAARALTLALGDRSPALQFRAMESLKQITGENFEGDAERWRTYVKGEIQIDRDPPSFAEQLSRMLR